MARQLTENEKNELEISVKRWLSECKRWVEEFEILQPEKLNDFYTSDNIDSFVIPATYFIMTAGCVYLHCQSLLEAKLGDKNRAKSWLDVRRNNSPDLQSLLDRRDWLSHGAIYRNQDFRLDFAIVKGPDKTIKEAIDEIINGNGEFINGKKVVKIREGVSLRWTDGYGKPTDNVVRWQKNVVTELESIVDDIKEIA